MGRKTSKNFKIGDTFLTWIVEECVNPKKYRYRCRCSECNVEREFIKYNLLRGSYAPCKKCGHTKVKDLHIIRKHFNCELNGSVFTDPKDFSLTQSYWFVCNKKHNFKSSIKDFTLDRCLSCQTPLRNAPAKVEAYEYALQYFKSIFNSVIELDKHTIILQDISVAVSIVENDRYTNHRTYFGGEGELLEEVMYFKDLKSKLISQGFKYETFQTENNLKNNVDNLKQLVIRLVHKI